MTVYAIFDKDGDQKLSQKEFIGVMADRFARQQKVLLMGKYHEGSTKRKTQKFECKKNRKVSFFEESRPSWKSICALLLRMIVGCPRSKW